MRRQHLWATLGLSLLVTASVTTGVTARQPGRPGEADVNVASTLRRVGERVERYFARAQSIMCIETVRWQPLGLSLGAEGFARQVESELRLSWDPDAQPGPALEATTVRQVVKVNGHRPRTNDRDNCTTPEQNTTETQPLSMLLPSQRSDYTFTLGGRATVDRRRAILLDFQEVAAATVAVEMVKDNENCISFNIQGGSRGRIWVDADTYDVLRLDQRLGGNLTIPMPKKARRSGAADYWTMERMDSSIRFKPVTFQDPEETLVLPVSVTSLRITHGSGTPRLRTTTEYSRYKRFLTGGRIVQHEPGQP